MIKIMVPSKKVKEELIKESRYLEYEVRDIDSDKANTLMHLYLLPDENWIIDKNLESTKTDKSK